jgi:hypothetical protein
MLRQIIPITALMLFLTGDIGNSSLAQTAGEDPYSGAMKVWSKSQNLFISEQAENLITSGFDEFSVELTGFGGNVRWKNGTRTLNQTLVTYYLSDLRDLKVAKSHPAFIVSSRIEVPDVEAYPVKEFFSKNSSVLNGRKGELHTVSQPSGASIVLDNLKKRGFTEKITVEEAGEHSIQVVGNGVQCSDKVTVPDGGTVTFHCP